MLLIVGIGEMWYGVCVHYVFFWVFGECEWINVYKLKCYLCGVVEGGS